MRIPIPLIATNHYEHIPKSVSFEAIHPVQNENMLATEAILFHTAYKETDDGTTAYRFSANEAID